MNKFLWVLLLITVSYGTANAQSKKINLLEKDIGGLHFTYMKITDQGNTDTKYILTMSFKNADNNTTAAVKTITITSDDISQQFRKDLTTAITQMDAGEDVDMSWDRKNYSLDVMEKQKGIYLYAENRGGYIFLNKKNSDKLLELMNRISFGSDEIAP